jgi:hypothetical protein
MGAQYSFTAQAQDGNLFAGSAQRPARESIEARPRMKVIWRLHSMPTGFEDIRATPYPGQDVIFNTAVSGVRLGFTV